MSAQEEPTKAWYQLCVVANGVAHYSEIDECDEMDLEDLYGIARRVVSTTPGKGGEINFTTQDGGHKVFIPSHRIEYITVLKVDPPE